MSLSLQLPPDLDARLQHLAAQTGRSQTDYVLEAVREYLDDLEDVALAEEELEAIRVGASSTVPLAEVMREYGMDN